MRDLGDKKYTCSSIFLASLVCVLPPEAAYARGTSVELTPTDSFVVGGEPVSTCQWPTAVYLDSAGCTGTLVAPNVITYAAHCGKNVATSVQFGEGGSNGFSRKVAIESCAVNPSFNQNFGEGVDFAYCILAEKITDIPITPIMHGCEREAVRAGEKVWIVGFGNTQGKPQGGGGGTKREVEVSINSVKDNGEVVVGGSGKGACHGDSGGPLFMQLPEDVDPKRGWRVFGATSYGPDACPGETNYSLLYDKDGVAWIESSSGIDITPCFDGATGDWDPNSECQADWASDPSEAGRSWDDGCDQPRLAADLCGPGVSDEVAPEVEIVNPTDGDIIMPGTSFTVEADASDDVAVVSVELKVDGVSKGVDESAPYEWADIDLDEGNHELVATALDAAGNRGESAAVLILVGEADSTTSDTTSSDSTATDSTDSNASSTSEDLSETLSGSDTGSDSASTSDVGSDATGSSDSGESSSDPGQDGGGKSGGCSTSAPSGTYGFFGSLGLLMFASSRRNRQSRRRINRS